MKSPIISFLFLISILAYSSCSESKANTEELKTENFTTSEIMKKPKLIHTVYFWLKEDLSEEQNNSFEQSLIALGKVPSILSYHYGPPAATTERGVIDNSYSWALNVHFNSIEDEAAYQVDPIHLKFVEENKDLWYKVVVYDNVVK